MSKNIIDLLDDNDGFLSGGAEPNDNKPNKIVYNLSPECEKMINEQITNEFEVAQLYFLFYTYFIRHDVALCNVANYFYEAYKEERIHAEVLTKYLIKRGGNVKFNSIDLNSDEILAELGNWKTAGKSDILIAFEMAKNKEKDFFDKFNKICECGNENKDNELVEFLGQYLFEQRNAVYETGVICTQLERIGINGHGLWHFDQTFECNKKCDIGNLVI